MRQFYKYFLLAIAIFYFKYSFVPLVNMLISTGPLWLNLKLILKKIDPSDLIGGFISIDLQIVNMFWMCINECIFFIFSTIILYFCYTRKQCIDRLMILIYLSILIFKYIYVFTSDNLYPTRYYFFYNFGSFITNPIYNYPYYLIGILFGKINYIVQKSISNSQIMKEKKFYLKTFFHFIKRICYLRSSTNYAIIFICILVIMSFSQITFICSFIFDISNDMNFNAFNESTIINAILLLDIDIVVFIVHLLYFTMFINGNSVINKLLKESYYLILTRLYYSLLIFINPIILYIYYQSESIITLEHFNILLFFIICSFCLIIFSVVVHIMLEIPLKKINKYLLEK
jgi:hypothetical protein